ncbi:MAG: hypothetical protein ACLGHN_09925 [Bacteriovoracia bacterium]
MRKVWLLIPFLIHSNVFAKTSDKAYAQAMGHEEQAPAMKNKTGTKNGIKTNDVNTSPTKAPATDEEVIKGSTLNNQGVPEDAVIRQQEEAPENIRPIMP